MRMLQDFTSETHLIGEDSLLNKMSKSFSQANHHLLNL